ncbi:MAG TPA: hypothetical protein VFX11_15510 [Candidatus Kapabacteria bacterium]|nr:hypothetical protein [Candidatus Kapabacteria bacterium]
MTQLRQEQISAASAFAETSLSLLGSVPGMTTDTLILSAARMAGTFLFRSYAHALNATAPGTVLLSQVASESGPRLVGLLTSALDRLGIRIDTEKVDLNRDNTPVPVLSFLDSQRLLEPALLPVRERFSLSHEEAAQAMAVATAMLIKHQETSLQPQTAFGLAVYGFIEGTKTVPQPILH